MKNLFIFSAVLLLFSCKENTPKVFTVNGVSFRKDSNSSVLGLSVTDSGYTFNSDAIRTLLIKNAANKGLAIQYFKEGEKVLRKDKKYLEAITWFNRSVETYPSPEVYFELGNAYMEARQFERADKAYAMANLISRLNDESVLSWDTFIKAFAIIKLPYTIDKNSDRLLTDEHVLSDKYRNYVNMPYSKARFSRNLEVLSLYYSFARCSVNVKHPVVIYASRSQMEKSFASQYWIVFYDSAGNYIDKMNIAGQNEGTSVVKECTINADLSFEVKTFQNTYQKPPEKEGYFDNPIVSTKLTETKVYKIDDAGRFVEVRPVVGMK